MKKLLPLLSLLFTLSETAQIQIKGTLIDGLSNGTFIGADIIIKESWKGTYPLFIFAL